MKDLFGNALLDYWNGNYTEDLYTETTISERDVLPLPYLFRSYSEMPTLEQKALDLAYGKTLDIGCGSGSHSVYLKEKGLNVTAIDISEGAVQVAKLRGLNARLQDVMTIEDEEFDTLLMLMNGTGIFQKTTQVVEGLMHLKTLLNPGGQILVDSSDLRYMYDTGDDGAIWVPGELAYYGEVEYTVFYKGEQDDPFWMLYLDEALFAVLCQEAGFSMEIVQRGDNYDYLARLTASGNNHV